MHFGLGTAPTADIEIHWPSGTTETYSGLAAGQLVIVREKVAASSKADLSGQNPKSRQARFPDPL
jgi:hypothetical protein